MVVVVLLLLSIQTLELIFPTKKKILQVLPQKEQTEVGKHARLVILCRISSIEAPTLRTPFKFLMKSGGRAV